MNPLRVAVIGAGHLGRIHARLLGEVENVDVVAIVDPVEPARRAIADAAGAVHAARIEDAPEIDAAVVAAPTALHHRLVKQLLQAGVHVLVEKPIAENTWQADELLAAAAGTQTVLQVGHSERFNPAWTVARQEIESPTWINAVRCGPYSFRSTEVGVVLDLMIHDIDLVLDLVQSPPEQIEATGGVVFGPHEDWAQASIRFADGCWATFVASRVEVEGRRRMQIRSSQTCADLDFGAGAARFVTRRPAANHFRPDEVAIADRADWKERLFSDLLEIDEREPSSWNAILDEQRDFVDAIKRGEAPRVSGRQGRDALAVAERIIDQITNGRGGLRRAG